VKDRASNKTIVFSLAVQHSFCRFSDFMWRQFLHNEGEASKSLCVSILYNRKCMINSNAHLLIMGRYWLWQRIDGLALLVIVGALSTYIFISTH